jgi:uncharacterized protein (TIGR03437 family)
MGRTTTTKRITLFLGLVAFSLFGTAFAQTSATVNTRIGTSPAGLRVQVIVDGQTYYTPQAFSWQAGSQHTLIAFNSELNDVTGTTQYTVTGFTTSIGPCPSPCVLTVHPSITDVTMQVAVSYMVRVNFAACGSESPGRVTVGGSSLTCSGFFYVAAGPVGLTATPNPGWVFDGWYRGTNADSQAFLSSTVIINAPIGIYPRFVRTRPITIDSSPQGLQVLADRQTVNTPAALTWGRGTSHALGSLPDQMDNFGKLWVFDKWSDGGAINHSYVVPDPQGALTLTANFVPGQRVSFYTNPPGLSLTVDGRTNWLNYNFAWAADSQHTVSAPLTQVDENGTRYVFKGWSQGGDAAQIITAALDPAGLNRQYTATYEGSGRVTITSDTPGILIQVDGSDCALPCSVEKSRGTPIRLTAPRSLSLTDDSRLDLIGWNDVADADRTIAAPGGPLKLSLNYRLRNRLNATITPPEGARLVTDPAVLDGFFDAQSQVKVTIETKLGFKFQNWEGDTGGSSRSVSINMSSPRVVRAILDRVPALLEDAVKNAAGDTPVRAVAPGSIISIYGVNLASDLLIGPVSPLSQVLNNVTVRIGGRILPLLFVSPGQINAQLPSDLVEGGYTLTVAWEGKPDVSADFKVVRNAPGLFNNVIEGRAYGLFLHENGDPVTLDSPARRNEVITLLGTGLGPYLQAPPDGFGIPESAAGALLDSVTILTADSAIDPSYAGVADGRVGVSAIRFKIGDKIPGSGPSEIRLRVLDQESNTVLLPVE